MSSLRPSGPRRGAQLYEDIYCARGDMENRTEKCQVDLYADRTSAHTMRANQLRLWFASPNSPSNCPICQVAAIAKRWAAARPPSCDRDKWLGCRNSVLTFYTETVSGAAFVGIFSFGKRALTSFGMKPIPPEGTMKLDSKALLIAAGLAALTALSLFSSGNSYAEDYQIGDVKLRVNGVATMGTSIRTSDRDLRLIPPANGKLIGVPGIAVGGRNGDDGDLNFGKGKPVSSVVKGVVSVDASYGNVGAFARGNAWYDYTLSEGAIPWGNVLNGYAAGRPLSDLGFDNAAKFASVSLLDAYVYGKLAFGSTTVAGRLGNQMIEWGSPLAIYGGLFTTINAIDFNALSRPGVQPEEVGVRMPAAYGQIDVTPNFGIEGFYQFKNTQNQSVGCGTFYATSDYVAPGCDYVVLGSGSDRTSFLTGSVTGRAPTPDKSGTQFGIGETYRFDSISTKVGFYYANVDSRSPSVGVVASTRVGNPFIAGNSDGKNWQYFTEYPSNISVYSGIFTTKLNATTISGEATFKQNAPVFLNAGDFLNAFSSLTASTLLRADQKATPPGGIFHGYDTFNQGYYQLALLQALPGVLGATTTTLGGQAALKQVYDLPDVRVRRYGRPDVFGLGAVNGVCPVTAPAYQCSTDGYVTSNAFGYQLNSSLRYENVFKPSLQLTPSIGLTHDVRGWSADTIFSQGRLVLNLALRVDYKDFFASVTWNPALATGRYDNRSDRQVATISSGVKF